MNRARGRLTGRRIFSLSLIFCGLGLAFSGFSFAALGRTAGALFAVFGGLLIVAAGITVMPRPVRPRVVGWTPGANRNDGDAPPPS
jgi:hypothetical protein